MKILATFQLNSNPNDDECAKLLTSPHVENKLDEIIKYACKGKEKIAECIEQWAPQWKYEAYKIGK